MGAAGRAVILMIRFYKIARVFSARWLSRVCFAAGCFLLLAVAAGWDALGGILP